MWEYFEKKKYRPREPAGVISDGCDCEFAFFLNFRQISELLGLTAEALPPLPKKKND
jgi:hypothetical protein